MKMKLGVVLVLCGFSALASADTTNVKGQQVYIGQEVENGHAHGDICYITVHNIEPLADKGLHCHRIDYQLNSIRSDMPKDVLSVDSRVTNYHRPEFPKLRTCAMNIDGTTSGPEIYGEDSSILYNQIFGGSFSKDGVRYDYFLTVSPKTKLLVRSRVHVTKAFSEYDVDCLGLQLM